MQPRLWLLGAPDPEMSLIEHLLRQTGEQVIYATHGGARVHPGAAYKCDPVPKGLVPWGGVIYMVECEPAGAGPWPEDADGRALDSRLILRDGVAQDEATSDDYVRVYRVDHHRPGDPGYGRPPAEFLPASSIGQVLTHLARDAGYFWGPQGLGWFEAISSPSDDGPGLGVYEHVETPEGDSWFRLGVAGPDKYGEPIPTAIGLGSDIVLAAAADHCLAAAYAGQCPGVSPDDLMRWRAETRAAHQKRSVADVLRDVEASRELLRRAPRLSLGGVEVADMRPGAGAPDAGGWGDVPELPEAAARDGVPFMAIPRPGPDGRRKLVLQAAPAEAVQAFLAGEGPAADTVDRYGDPARGFAGGYLDG